MTRGFGELGPIQDAVPEGLAPVIALLTQLGDIWFLSLLLVVLYWIDVPSQDDVALVAGAWLAGMGLYKGLKEIFGFPRPDQPLLDPTLLPGLIQPVYELTAFATGYGFPSGHAVNATIVYFGLAHVLAVSTRRRRHLAAAFLVVIVCFTRVALGVHYLVDVVVGVAVGATLLGGAWALQRRLVADPPSITFALAVGFGAFFVAASDLHHDALLVLAASLGAFAGWQLIVLGRRLVELDRPSAALRPVVARGGLAATAGAPLVASLEYFPLFSAYAASGVVGLLAAAVVVVPVMRYSTTVRRFVRALRFWATMTLAGLRYLLRPETREHIVDRSRAYGARLRTWIRQRRQ